jgi:hypothetical protein
MCPATLVELSYAAALRALDLQERGVEQLRGRTGTLLAATSLTASFLGAQSIANTKGLSTLGALALVALATSILTCIYILLPKRGFIFSVSGVRMFESLFEFKDDADEARRHLVYWLEGYYNDNQTRIDRLGRCYAVAALALALQVLLWCVALATTLS